MSEQSSTDRKAAFLAALLETGSVSESARRAGVARVTPYFWRGQDPVFKATWDEVIATLGDMLEDEAVRRALDGVEEPVYYLGHVVGYKRVYSDSLLLALLKALKPEKYRERMEIKAEVDIAEILRAGRRRLTGKDEPAADQAALARQESKA